MWQTEITVSWAGTDRVVPLTNWAGRCYPSFPGGDEFLARVLGITPEDHVLDVGGGAEPFHYASVVCERDLRGTDQRAGRSAKLDRRFVAGDAQALPFPDRSFDFAFSRHVLEHVADPKAACTEMMRVAARGFIETPCALSEYLVGDPTHRWLVRAEDRTLIFTPRPFVEHPFGNVLRWLLHADSELFFKWEMAYPQRDEYTVLLGRNLSTSLSNKRRPPTIGLQTQANSCGRTSTLRGMALPTTLQTPRTLLPPSSPLWS